ncbi:hypothetical protein EDI_275530 [Entamoeba dispar SAW760]|uniref:Uncharacterized protein n=1 Tax=Entamoeba dispar (strain ATCC PRA-260 / SAW760) TaxID=370354 RepID=B0E7K5_ENTDS|nr:uncharacterized protein EDI_275530 [Entamoeba dispar SAW760]EDR29475.1 hypothetical protein EDI_275530 [Entamoeba dispar SAW760]|eukprot:EDR29475.1 hypothetical protein EDI_275530 [Entamoeba dispar SAW760]
MKYPYFFIFIYFVCVVWGIKTYSLPPNTHVKTTQKYNSTTLYIINTQELLPNSMYEITLQILGNNQIPFFISLFELNSSQTVYNETTLRFITDENSCVIYGEKEECQSLNCYVRIFIPNNNLSEINYFIFLKRGKWGLLGNTPTIVFLGILCIIIAAIITYWIVLGIEKNQLKHKLY